MADVAGGDALVVIANTADDFEIYGAHVSPDPDLVTFWLADRIDARGWGLDGDTFHVMDGLRALGRDVWFNLGDRDLAIGIERARRLAEGARLTEALAELGRALEVPGRVLPMCDEPVRTRVRARGRGWPFQEWMILGGGEGPVEDVALRRDRGGAPDARGARRDRAGARDRDRALQPRRLDRRRSSPSPACARRCARRPRRSSPSARSSAARC